MTVRLHDAAGVGKLQKLRYVVRPFYFVPLKPRHAHRSPACDDAIKTPRGLGRDRSRGAVGKPLPSDHAPLVIDIDNPGHPFDAGWASADSRIAARRS
ncbi:MAG: hypothetical protein JSS39_20070 [Nitrospira sp.]|nr:hypothetical protein [Nitrospira sp.]